MKKIEPKKDTEDAKEQDNRREVAELFRFVATVEETKIMDKHRATFNKPPYIKPYNRDRNDWTENHFFYKDGKQDDACKVLFTSYQVETLMENCSRVDVYSNAMPIKVNDGKDESGGFYYVQAQKPCNAVPIPNITPGGVVHKYLDRLKKVNAEFFEDNCPLEEVLESLSEENLTVASKGGDHEVASFAKTYRKALVDRDLKTMFKPLDDWQGGTLDKTIYELTLGLGHARMIYNKKNSEDQKILNAPLIEVPVEIDEESLKVVPVPGSRLKWNGEAKTALLFAGGRKKKILSDFQTLVVKAAPKDVVLGDPQTYLKFVEKASEFCWHGEIKKPTDDSLHEFPQDSGALVLTAGWCLFVRPKRSNSISNDAHLIAKTVEATDFNLSLPLRSLVLGSNNEISEKSEPLEDGSGPLPVLPLPASKSQLEMIRKVFSKNNDVTLIRGPPGTGKTQTGLNMASVVLQRGFDCLVTSDNPRALEAFEQKLPEDLKVFCINMSSMQEDGISKLSQTLDRLEAKLVTLLDGKDSHEKMMETLEQKIDRMKKDRGDLMAKLEVRSKINRGLMEQNGFSQLVKHGLKGDSKVRPVILSILQHHDLDGLKRDIMDLSEKQGIEALESISFRCDDSQNITQDLIHFAEKKATPAGPKSTGKRRQLSMFPLHSGEKLLDQIESFRLNEDKKDRKPVTPDDWSRVVRGLKVRRSQSDFREVHVNSLVNRGFPKTLIYGPDDVTVRQEFIENVTGLYESVDGVGRKDLDDLLQFLEDVSSNRKSQEVLRDFSMRLRELKVELVYATIARNRSGFTGLDLGNFSQLKELTLIMKDSEIDAAKASDATKRKAAKFAEKFRKSLGCMPLLLMTTDQVSRYIPVDHRFRLVIADEASQSPSSTALTILSRAKQAVVLGDSKQALPTDDLTEESKSALDKCSGDQKHKLNDLFLPGNGNSLYEVCLSRFAGSLGMLKDNFRSPADSISWSNTEIYSDQIQACRPNGSRPSLRLNVTRNGTEEMAQFLYDIVEDTLSSDIDNEVPTLGVIMMGQKREAKAFKEVLDTKLIPLENQYGTEAVGRHCIKVATPEEFQGDQRNIILIGCLPENSKVPYETSPDCRRLWNVATTRHKRESIIFSSYDLNRIKKGDIKHKIFFMYKHPETRENVRPFKAGKTDIRSMAEDRLFDQLASHGYETRRNASEQWKNALSIGLKNDLRSDSCQLVSIENYGETADDWRKVVHQQEGLEELGISCLRVDALALSLNFQAVFEDVIAFLSKAGLPPPTNFVSDKSDAASNATTRTSDDNISVDSDTKLLPCSRHRKRSPGRTSSRDAKRRKGHLVIE
ncbi:unnamed protein product [Pseudo-nitzschia multistriata]|uniref:DNA2/NAM7 helicase-like C-terminal domain-containing protein n=1 Tax=Pseudo-nitzschia multistriata TaxID=183589 RepID=A0A448ZBN0_9STRA|nr:unnamed protein product [Pseudo-nitzschia multistriata]